MPNHFDTLHFCPFARAILKGNAACVHAISAHIAERHTINCTKAEPSARCQAYIEASYQRAKFVLKSTSTLKALPSGKKTKLQIGLLQGLSALLAQPADDIDQLLDTAAKTYKTPPYAEIIPHINACNPRKA